MEVKIGIRDVGREVVLESELTPDAVAEAVAAAVSGGELLRLTDDKGRLIIVPGPLIGYVEVGAPDAPRRFRHARRLRPRDHPRAPLPPGVTTSGGR